jgi:hypothetical protein
LRLRDERGNEREISLPKTYRVVVVVVFVRRRRRRKARERESARVFESPE